MQAQLVFSARHRIQLISSRDVLFGSGLLEYINVSLRVRFTRNFLHAKEGFTRHDSTAPPQGKTEFGKGGRQSLIYLLNFPIAKKRRVMASRFRIDRKQHQPGRLPVQPMDGAK